MHQAPSILAGSPGSLGIPRKEYGYVEKSMSFQLMKMTFSISSTAIELLYEPPFSKGTVIRWPTLFPILVLPGDSRPILWLKIVMVGAVGAMGFIGVVAGIAVLVVGIVVRSINHTLPPTPTPKLAPFRASGARFGLLEIVKVNSKQEKGEGCLYC